MWLTQVRKLVISLPSLNTKYILNAPIKVLLNRVKLPCISVQPLGCLTQFECRLRPKHI